MTLNHKPAYPPLLPALTGICCGILTAFYLPDLPVALFLILFVFTLAAFATPLRLTFAMAAISLLAGGWGITTMARLLRPERAHPSVTEFTDGPPCIISGRISSFTTPSLRKTRYTLSCETVTSVSMPEPVRVTGKIYLSVYKRPDYKPTIADRLPLLYGSRIRVEAPLRSIRNFANPDGFDYAQFLRFKGINASAWTTTDKIRFIPSPGEPWIRIIQGFQKVRQRCHSFILSRAGHFSAGIPDSSWIAADRNLKRDAAAVLSAMVLGQKSGLSNPLKDRFARAGISHLLAISGLHLSIIGFLSFLVILQIFRPFPYCVNLGLAKKTALALTLIPLSGYAVLSGFSPATQRAMIMAAVLIWAMLIDRETDPLNVLCLAGLLILSIDPSAVFSVSFQLSFFAVAGIILGLTLVNKKELMPRSKWSARIVTAFWVSLFAGAATFPLTARYFNTASYIFMFSNLIFVPVIGLGCLPIGLAASATLFVYPPLANGLMDLALALISFCLSLVSTIAALPFASSRIVAPSLVEIGLFYLMAGGLFAFFAGYKGIGKGCMAIAVAAGLGCMGLDVKHRFFSGQLTATVLDVGQGESSVVKTPEGKVILLDCGGFSSGSGFNVGRYVVGPYLWREKIMSIDLVILSHPQADHMNGLGFILDNFNVGLVVRNKDTSDSNDFAQLLAAIQTKNIPVRTPDFPGTDIDVGAVRVSFYPARTQSRSDLNHNSLVVRLNFKKFSMLMTGDIDAAREAGLCLAHPFSLESTIMLAPHHGSRTASTKIFLDQVNPESVIVSCGYRNRYGFPHFEVLKRYHSKKIKVYRTDLNGAVTIRTRGGAYQMTTCRNH